MNCEIDSSVGHMNSEGPITSVVHVTAWLAHLEAVDGGEGDAGEVVGAVPGLEQRAQRPDLGLVGRQTATLPTLSPYLCSSPAPWEV